MGSRATIPISLVVLGGSTYAKQVSQGKLTVRPLLGILFAGMFLYGIYSFDQGLANGFALLILTTALLVNGGALFSAISNALKP